MCIVCSSAPRLGLDVLKERNLLPLLWIERRFLRCLARTIGTMSTELSRHSHPRHRTEMVVVSTLWTIFCRRMSPHCLFCRRFWGCQRQSGYRGGNDSSFARLKLKLVSISSTFSVLRELPWHFLLKFLHSLFVFAKLNEGMLLHCYLATATTRIILCASSFSALYICKGQNQFCYNFLCFHILSSYFHTHHLSRSLSVSLFCPAPSRQQIMICDASVLPLYMTHLLKL